MTAPRYHLTTTDRVDLMGEASAILSFMSESFSALAVVSNATLSEHSLEGLAYICTYLQTLCEAAAA